MTRSDALVHLMAGILGNAALTEAYSVQRQLGLTTDMHEEAAMARAMIAVLTLEKHAGVTFDPEPPTPGEPMSVLDEFQALAKALEAGNYDARPGSLVQGGALQVEDLSTVMKVVTFDNATLKLAKMIGSESCKSTLAQFNRQLSYGNFGGAAGFEGNVGQEETSDYVRVTVPMAYYSHVRRVSYASTLVDTVDGKKSDERAAADAAILLAGNIEFDGFLGMAGYSNAGVFDGHPGAIPQMPSMHGIDLQVRQSDFAINSRDLMFAEYGSDDSVVLSGGGGTLTQDKIEDTALRVTLNFGKGDTLIVDPVVFSNYNKIALGKERIILAGAPQGSTGSDLRKQYVSGGTVNIEAGHFLRGKAKPQRPRNHPKAPVAPTIGAATVAGTTGAIPAGVYLYYATTGNEIGESVATATQSATVAAGNTVVITVTHPSGTSRYFNFYRSPASGTAAQARFIGRVAASSGTTTDFTDLGNRVPGFTTGYMIDGETMTFKELCAYSRTKLMQNDLSLPEAHFRFLTLAITEPRKMAIIDNLKGQF